MATLSEAWRNPEFPPDLPISAHVEEIAGLLAKHPVLIVAGETGSGKTTQLPKICLRAGLADTGVIGCTQPRRVAALAVSRRIAEELSVEYGKEVGAKIRFTDRTSAQTKIKVMTDGMLLSEIERDRTLRGYSALIVDEAHERSLNIDFLLGYLKKLREKRPELKIIITSATIDTKTFSKAFDDAPIVEVSGRMFPVEIVYSPLDTYLEDRGDFTYVEGVAQAVEDIIDLRESGDILVFLPGERDIREARELLDGRNLPRLEVLPLFGRLSNADQERIFKRSNSRKVILATNIAETSLTIPGIRYVVDAGLARLSRYSSSTHTQRLPIEAISQSSANQRAGRAGRLEDGVCIRLYSEEDYNSRPQYSIPEILRSNLASVILRMEAFRLGKVEDFPFIEPPTTAAITGGYALLHQLGAMDETRKLTEIGRKMAKIPVDPTVARILLQAGREGAMKEILIIAAGLSIQDPREVPVDAREAAREMHAKFRHPQSDFLTLLQIWDLYHDEMERLSQAKLRKFCKAHFLSYMRMREWRDIHQQLSRVMKEMGDFHLNKEKAEYHQVHRALMTGFLGGIACRDEGNTYRGPRNRVVQVFPGSSLFDRDAAKRERKKKFGKPLPMEKPKEKAPPWILAAEWVETTKAYARNCAGIEPAWILDLGRHLIQTRYSEPFYDEKEERVVVRERIFLFGLEVRSRRVGYAKLEPEKAADIFIQAALVDDGLTTPLRWLDHNRQLRARIENLQTRLRSGSSYVLDERVFSFYHDRLVGVGSIGDLRREIKKAGGDRFLFMEEKDLVEGKGESGLLDAFPRSAQIGQIEIPLQYRYEPGEADDGATLRVPVSELAKVDPKTLDWCVPGFVEETIHALLRGLPKPLRQQLFPIQEKAKVLSGLVQKRKEPIRLLLRELIRERYGIEIYPEHWNLSVIPEYLKPRIEVINTKNEVIASGRNWEQVKTDVRSKIESTSFRPKPDDRHRSIWSKARKEMEISRVDLENCPEWPEEVAIGSVDGVPLLAWPGLRLEDNAIAGRLFPSAFAAKKDSGPAFSALVSKAFGRELAWIERDLLKELQRTLLDAGDIFSGASLCAESLGLLKRHYFEGLKPTPVSKEHATAMLAQATKRASGSVPRWVDLLVAIFKERSKLLREFRGPVVEAEVAALVHPKFLRTVDWKRAERIPVYLRAIGLRMEKAQRDPLKDAEKVKLLTPWLQRFAEQMKSGQGDRSVRWLLEEYKVQLFAQELGTVDKVSPKILEQRLSR